MQKAAYVILYNNPINVNSDSVFIRPLVLSDISRLVEIDAVSNPTCWTKNMFEKELDLPFSVSAVALNENGPVGFGIAWIVSDCIQLLQLAMDPYYRKRGTGTLILKYLIRYAQKKGCRKMELEFREGNETAKQFYEKMGFKTTGRRKNFYDCSGKNSCDAILMECELVP